MQIAAVFSSGLFALPNYEPVILQKSTVVVRDACPVLTFRMKYPVVGDVKNE